MSDELPPDQEPKGQPDPTGTITGAGDGAGAAANDRDDDRDEALAGRRTAVLIVAVAAVVLAAIGVGIYLVATSGESDVADPAQPTITAPSQPEPPPSSPPPSEPAAPATEPPPPAIEKNVVAARTAAEQAATAINARDITAMKRLSCDPKSVGSAEEFPPRATARLVESPQVTGNKATAQIELSISGSEPTVVPLPLEKRGGKWCVP